MTGKELQKFMEGMNDQQKVSFLARYLEERKDPLIGLIFSIGWGILGADRFYVGDIALGIAKLVTLGGLYIWWIVDIFLIQERVREFNRRKAGEIAREMGYIV